MDLETVVHGSIFTSDQSVSGIGLVNGYTYYADTNSDGSQSLNVKTLSSGTGSYSHNSSTNVQNNVVTTRSGDFASSNQKITSKDDLSAVYAPTNFQIPGSFRVKSIRSLWKDQTCAQNHAGLISMNSLFDYAKMLNKETTTTMYSDQTNYQGFIGSTSSNIGSSMDINSNFDGVAHLGATINDVKGREPLRMKGKSDNAVLVDEDYRGYFFITKNMAVNIKRTTNYGDYYANYEGDNLYPWLPCLCNAGWDDMTIHDQRYHSAKDFFNCTTCWPPGPC